MAKPSGRFLTRSERRSGSRRGSDIPRVEPSITRERLIERQLRESQKLEALGALAGGIAHDFNNILNILSSYASLIARDAASSPAILERLDAIQRTIGRGAGVVHQLVTIARRGDAIFAPVDLNAVVEELSRLLRETFPRSIDLEVRAAPGLPPIKADAGQLMQALLNLCLNARDAMPAGGRLTLETRRDEWADGRPTDRVCVTIEDDGIGMDEALRARIFEPFFTTKEPAGTGLGLPIVAGIVQGHGGRVEVESSPGQGTRVRLRFPAAEIAPFEESAPPLDAPSVSSFGRTVLLVEDEPLLLEASRLLLEAEGYRVLGAGDGVSALEIFEAKHDAIDVVVADVGLPGLGGWQTFLRMKVIDPGVSAILTSGFLPASRRAEYSASGVKASIRKPYSAEELLRRIGDVLPAR
jgi:CheY-like chemotaxis protein/two-component sensor histidine kinase